MLKKISVLAPEDSRIPFCGVICPTQILSPTAEKVWRIPVLLV